MCVAEIAINLLDAAIFFSGLSDSQQLLRLISGKMVYTNSQNHK